MSLYFLVFSFAYLLAKKLISTHVQAAKELQDEFYASAALHLARDKSVLSLCVDFVTNSFLTYVANCALS